jgi:hypothetical protein
MGWRPGGGGGEPTRIAAATWRWDGTSGTVLVSSGFPLKPGQVTASTVSQVRVYVAGVEKAVAIHPLDGTFPDGSYRSIGIQFSHNLTHNTPVTAEVHVQAGARGTSDLTWVEPTRAVHVVKKAVIAPTAPTHLCGTFTLAPPAAGDTGPGAIWAARLEDAWNNEPGVKDGASAGPDLRPRQRAFALYCRTGTRAYYQSAYDWRPLPARGLATPGGNYQLLLPPVLRNGGPWPVRTHPHGTRASERLDTSTCGDTNEQNTMRVINMASVLMTAWRQPKHTSPARQQGALRNELFSSRC